MSQGRDKILEASLQEFSEKGFDGARMDRIARNASVNKALIYYHFKSKEELYTAVIDALFEKAMSASLEPSGTSVRDNLLQVLEQFIRFLHHHPYFVKIMDQSVGRDSGIFEKLHRQNLFFEQVMALYLQGVRNGECRQVDQPADYIVSLLGACYFFFSHQKAVRKFYGGLTDDEILSIRVKTIKDMVSRVLF